ncbi:MAG: hypothetical protein BWY57_00056 [Betaproteobacteria bacterium ADurb.Bin341]|nr:MAG: hypothetical protein BWY57_00056 [Betaproteobacteria bacterium ADurb.Bin341]
MRDVHGLPFVSLLLVLQQPLIGEGAYFDPKIPYKAL